MSLWRFISFALFLCLSLRVTASEVLPTVRVAALSYGSASWELQVMKTEGLDRAHGFDLAIVTTQSPAAAAIAIQGGSADVSVQDWLWVLRQYQGGRAFRFYPFSTAVGSLMVPANGAREIDELRGEPVGIAGGAADKGWVLLSQWYLSRRGASLAAQLEPKFASPPLLNQLAMRGDLAGVLTYWHYAARLEAQGFRTLMSVTDVLAALGVDEPVAMLGWVFADQLATQQPQLMDQFILASMMTKQRMAASDVVWRAAEPWMRAENAREKQLLINGFRAGIPGPFNDRAKAAISRVAAIYLTRTDSNGEASPVLNSSSSTGPLISASGAAEAKVLTDAGLFINDPSSVASQ